MWLAVLVQVVSVEHLWHLKRICGNIDGLLLESELAADQSVEWAREELCAEPVLWRVDGVSVAVVVARRKSTLRWSGWDSDVGLVVSVGSGDDNLELLRGISSVGGGGTVDRAAPECALEIRL